MEIGVGRWANKARDQGCQCPKVVNGTESGIDGSAFAFHVVVKQKPEWCIVGCVYEGGGRDGKHSTPFIVPNVANHLNQKNAEVEDFTNCALRKEGL